MLLEDRLTSDKILFLNVSILPEFLSSHLIYSTQLLSKEKSILEKVVFHIYL